MHEKGHVEKNLNYMPYIVNLVRNFRMFNFFYIHAVCGRVGRGNLVSRLSVPHFALSSVGIVY